MREIKLSANAKLNLTLDITGVREDGYHLLEMVNICVNLSDEIIIKRSQKSGVRITSNARFLPRYEKNLAYKAAAKLFEALNKPLPNLEIDITKRIPTKAGLGGGSADAAATLIGLNRLFSLGLTEGELCSIAADIGADVPYCVVGRPALVSGIGEIIEPIEYNADFCLVILMPRRGRSTTEAFRLFDDGKPFKKPETTKMTEALKNGDSSGAAALLCNAFATIETDETTERLISTLLAEGALGASLTGSGAAVFGIFPDMLAAKKCKTKLFGRGFLVYVARPERQGVRIVYEK